MFQNRPEIIPANSDNPEGPDKFVLVIRSGYKTQKTDENDIREGQVHEDQGCLFI